MPRHAPPQSGQSPYASPARRAARQNEAHSPRCRSDGLAVLPAAHGAMIASMAHEPRLQQSLRALLHARRTAALGTLAEDNATPFVTFVPYAIDAATGTLVLHVSGLAAHTAHLRARPDVSLLIVAAEVDGAPVHALERVTLQGTAQLLEPQAPETASARAAYLARFQEAEPMTQLSDFRFVAITPNSGRHVAGFGAARSVDVDALATVLRTQG